MKWVSSDNKIPIKSWCQDIEDGAMEQANNLANLPFAYKWIALMPDCHQGYGMPIGGVLATQGVIIPNAVGVDIGCFEKNTKVLLLDGSCDTLYNLSKRKDEFYVYSLDDIGEIVPGKAKALLTRRNVEVMEVCISGGETIICTPDHKFMLLNGEYREAKYLKPFDSLMPLYRSYESQDGYEHVRTKMGTGIATHKMVAEFFLGRKKKDDIVHHKDGNWYNNNPSNIEYKNKKLHNSEHRKANPIFGTDEFKTKRLEGLQKNGFYDKKYIEKKKEIGRRNFEKYNNSDKKKEQDKLAGQRGKKYFIRDNAKHFKCDICEKECKGLGAFSRHMKIHQNNHKVLWARKINKKIDVYCLQVEKYHNFALQAGVFVHNCGMCAIKTSLIDIDKETLKRILGKIREQIPVGFKHHEKKQSDHFMPDINQKCLVGFNIVKEQYQSALTQIGTLGGGNHFIEIQKGSDGHIWIMVHSGSRNIGYKTAKYYNDIAKKLNKKWYSGIPANYDLAFLPIDSEEGAQYLDEMLYCVDFALANRKLMMGRICGIFFDSIEVDFEPIINIAHNYARFENHFGKNVMVHRKGATLARKDTIGIVPGSQGTKSYIVQGLGNKESFESCSHGAGRRMGRKEAQRRLDLIDEVKKLNDKGILHSIRGVGDLDEAAGAYKDINEVMESQMDLVKIVVELEPLGVVKG